MNTEVQVFAILLIRGASFKLVQQRSPNLFVGASVTGISSELAVGSTSAVSTLFVQGSGGTNPFVVASSTGTALMTVTQAGNVGIGTTTPTTALDVSNGTNASIRTGSNGTEQGCLELYTSGGTLTYTYAASATSVVTTSTKPSFCQ